MTLSILNNMVKKKAADKVGSKVVAKCDNLYEVTYSQSDIERMIITIRGVQVMRDRDLATVYGVTTSQLNQQVKRNIARFPTNFRFQLTEAERDEVVTNCDNLRSIALPPSLFQSCKSVPRNGRKWESQGNYIGTTKEA